jgi:hypothetical protein
VVRDEPVNIGARWRARLQLYDAAPTVHRRIDQHSDLRRGERCKRDLLPDFVVSRHTTTRHPYETAAVPVLHFKRSQPIETEGRRFRGLDRVRIIILEREDGNLINRLAAIENNFHPLRKGGRRAMPVATITSAQSFAVADHPFCDHAENVLDR